MTTLTHPCLGERPFDEDHARRIMSKENTGGWEFKKPNLGAEKPLDFSKSEDAADVPTDKGKAKVPKEKGDN
jgi:hypothetical protein